ncbi:alpha/beta hydrolase [Streptomyces sp. NRRL S-920]|uniref:alpha/beta hydrolase n=1 Tax=Streptomyces sp. NRRL S-920 TaxID=1463921 RepID=UPI0004C6EB7D|nr:alpha/beta hydrolase [Streptomyces sp. NRRL S-920]
MRIRAGRLRRTLLAAGVAAAVAFPLSGAARPEIPAPAPAALGRVTAQDLTDAYAANRSNAAEAARMAERYGARERAAVLRAMASPDRHFLAFDGRGAGRTAEVFGDLAGAERVAVLVPGSDTSLDSYGRLRSGARALHGELGPRTAVVAWLGYETPGTVSPAVLTTGRADGAAPALRSFVDDLHGINAHARVSLLCHSYGSVVCASAASGPRGLDVTDIAFFGSPGTGVDKAADLHTPARIWAGRGADDWIADVPHTSADLFGTTVGFGTDPVSGGFGARVFAAGGGGHSDYLKPGSVPLENLARIARGDGPEVTHA